MAFRCVDNLADAEDAVQDAFLCAWRHLDKFKGEAQMSTWLTAIVINAARLGLKRTTLIAKMKKTGISRATATERNPVFSAAKTLHWWPSRTHRDCGAA
jgi:DNA-directed RNA polymerase specialized sigma24 family protein